MLGFLLTWYNLPFLLALGGGVLFALLQLLGGLGDSDSDIDLDTDADVDIDTAVADSHAASFDLFAALGIGRVPFPIVLMTLLGSLGAFGLLANTLATGWLGGYPSLVFLLVLVVGLIVSIALTAATNRAIGRVAGESSTAVGFQQLVGRVGTVSSATVSNTYGRVTVRDAHGTLHTVFAVANSSAPIPGRSEVALVAYDEAQKRFVVQPMR